MLTQPATTDRNTQTAAQTPPTRRAALVDAICSMNDDQQTALILAIARLADDHAAGIDTTTPDYRARIERFTLEYVSRVDGA